MLEDVPSVKRAPVAIVLATPPVDALLMGDWHKTPGFRCGSAHRAG